LEQEEVVQVRQKFQVEVPDVQIEAVVGAGRRNMRRRRGRGINLSLFCCCI